MPIQSRLGKKMELDIERLGINGEGVGQWYGYTIFVDGALPNEKVLTSLYEKRKSFGRARILQKITTSEHRIDPICPLFGECGGCQLMHLRYEQQLKAKRQRVVDALERIGKIYDVEVGECIASPSPLSYRNKIQLPVAKQGNSMRLGLYARNTHELIDMDTCHIHCALGENAYQTIKKILQNSSVSVFDPETNEGELKHVLIKTAVGTKQVLVIFVTAKEASEELRRAAVEVFDSLDEIRGVVQNINSSSDNTVLGDTYVTLAGQGSIEEKLCGYYFKVSPASFFQVNPSQAENLYRDVIDKAALTGNEIVLDAYCGVGTLSLLLAPHAKKVIGVECVPEAIEDAKENAVKNNIVNTEFHCQLAEEFIESQKALDVAVLNPPRKGCERSVLEKLSELKPKTIIYVSCDPATLARDLAFLIGKGWKLKSVTPYDMFPQTAHVESLAVLRL